jgi:hypothetical protein
VDALLVLDAEVERFERGTRLPALLLFGSLSSAEPPLP